MRKILGLIIVLVVVLAAVIAMESLQVSPGSGSVLFERTGGTTNDGISPMTDAVWTAEQRAANTGASLRLFSSAPVGSQVWTVSYVLTCAGVTKGSGSVIIGSWYDGTKSPLWFTIPNSQSRPAIEADDSCFVRVTMSSSGLSWRTKQTGVGSPSNQHDVVVWGEPLEPEEEPTQPPPPTPPPTIEPTTEPEPPVTGEPPPALPGPGTVAVVAAVLVALGIASLARKGAA